MRGCFGKALVIFILLLDIANLVFPLLTFASSPNSLIVSFDAGYAASGTLEGSKQLGLSGKIVTDWELIVGGVSQGRTGTYSSGSDTLTFTMSAHGGLKEKVIGREKTDPGHAIWRDLSGKKWQNQGADTDKFQFTGADEDGNGVSEVPGVIPSSGYNMTTGQSNQPYPDKLRYYYSVPHLKNQNYNDEGSAVTYSNSAKPPDSFYPERLPNGDVVDIRSDGWKTKYDAYQVLKPYVISNSITIVDAEGLSDNTYPYYYGQGQDGYGQISVRRMLDSYNSDPTFDYECLVATCGPTTSGVEGRNYYLSSTTYWEAYTYHYKGEIKVTYEDPQKPDLIPVSITSGTACIEAGVSTTFTYTVRNNGTDTSQSFRSRVTSGGTDVANSPFIANGLLSGSAHEKSGTFNHTFSTAGSYSFKFIVDIDGDIDEGAGEGNNTLDQAVTVMAPGGCSGGPPPNEPSPNIDADFTILKSTMPWKDFNTFTPTKINVTGACNYTKHHFEVYQRPGAADEARWLYSDITDKTAGVPMGYPYPTRPGAAAFTPGTVTVGMIVETDCGEHTSVWKTFEITFNNQPPQLQIGWVKPSDPSNAISTAIVGDTLNLRVLSYSDPDGDPVTFEWYFGSSFSTWVKSLPGLKGWSSPYTASQYTSIVASVVGSHDVCAVAKDNNGGVSQKACTSVSVVGPEPIPIINGASTVREGRTLNPPLDGNSSYSPVPGRTIDHTKDEWWSVLNYSDGTSATISGLPTSFSKPGTAKVFLNVFDNTGLKSVDPALHSVTILPDAPPVIQFDYSTTMTRSTKYFKNNSYSPDGDTVVIYRVNYGYDANNSGSCNPMENLISSDDQLFAFTPTLVGKYCFRVFAQEDYGKNASQDYTVEVINDNPTVDFTVTGTAEEPNPSTIIGYSTDQLLGWTNTSLDKWATLNTWSRGPGGTLMSAIRKNGTPSYSIPLGGTWGFSQRNISLSPSYPISSVLEYLGNDELFVILNMGLGQYAVVSPYHSPINLGSTWGGSYEYDPYLQEIVTKVGVAYAGSDSMPVSWMRYHLSDKSVHATGNVTYGLTRTGGYVSGSYISGTLPQFSNGRQLGHTAKLKFGTDYKEIDLTTRTISSYHESDMLHPYDVQSYTTIPALPQYSEAVYVGNPYSSVSVGPFDNLFCSKSGACQQDGMGNYYGLITYGGVPNLVKFDVVSGIPTQIKSGVSDSVVEVAEDGHYVKIHRNAYYDCPCGSDSDSGDWSTAYPPYDYWIDATNGSMLSSQPVGYSPPENKAALSVSQNGYYPKYTSNTYWTTCTDSESGSTWSCQETAITYPMTDYNSGTAVGVSALSPRDVRFLNDTDYLVGSSIFSYTPYTGQSSYSNESVTFGQLINAGSTPLTNGTVSWLMRFNTKLHPNYSAGMGFKIQNAQSMYRVEAYGSYISVVKIVNGRKTVLQQVSRTIPIEKWISYQVKISGTHIKVYEDGGLALDVYDGTYTTGSIGPYSTADGTEFKGVSIMQSTPGTEFDTPGVAIVDTDVTYDATYEDPEHDPRLDSGTQWVYHHVDTTKFLDAGDGKSGLSSLDGRTVNTVFPRFDKVGVYKIDYRVPDDTHPYHRIAYGDLLFQTYSKYSDYATKYLIVHRRPISIFTVAVTGSNTVAWTDYSYDPDRCYSHGSCQAGYTTNNGIYAEKYYYITPSGSIVQGRLKSPTETGSYIVGKAVGDEYNAWSDYYEQTISISATAAPNNPPVVALTFPTGSYVNPTPVSLIPTITWNMWDPDPDTTYTVFNLNIKDEWGNCIECVKNRSMNTKGTSWSWTMDLPLSMGQKYQVEVQIADDGSLWSPWSTIGWMATNSPPAAYMSNPWGTQADPTIFTTVRPTMVWSQTDPDPGTVFLYDEIQITNEDNTVMIWDSGKVWENTTSNVGSLPVGIDLPVGQKMRVRVKVWDNYGAESNWSPQAWMLIVPSPPPPTIDTDTDFDQRMNPDSYPVVVLDRHITIRFDGTYNFDRHVLFPFDVYSNDMSQLYPSNTLIDVGAIATFYMPTWNDEGTFAVYAKQCMYGTCREDYLNVSVAGRVFDFRISDIGDLRFEDVFRTARGSKLPTGNEYFSGGRDENGAPTEMYGKDTWILPVRPGSHPGQPAAVVHNGYALYFSFKTIGPYWGRGDGIKIDPTFWFIPKAGGNATKVDLYYDTSGSSNKMIKVGSAEDVSLYQPKYVLADPLRNVTDAEIDDAAGYEYTNILTPFERSTMTWARFYEMFRTRQVALGSGYGDIHLSYQSRTLIGDVPAGANAAAAQRSVQQWYGEYHIPIAPYILPAGTNILTLADQYHGSLTGFESEFMKDGYIVVNFGIYTLKNYDPTTKVLGYNAPRTNMWAVEGQINSATDWRGRMLNFKSGDLLLYDADYSIRNDYMGVGR
ncbi:CARDB domain-containing protein [Paenibacillus cremeus]|uniref:CARDB domain-containing protein n=1 Tax=Paenibacillus cremeus TaxID=2163881 RepID=A0A559K5B4_9BACL|nr:CARDB domain-containing protein [Paenibacillus cremeus]TVY07324.1 hypothetical protein FPZ49_24585 [Paenibacillus cremeus]